MSRSLFQEIQASLLTLKCQECRGEGVLPGYTNCGTCGGSGVSPEFNDQNVAMLDSLLCAVVKAGEMRRNET